MVLYAVNYQRTLKNRIKEVVKKNSKKEYRSIGWRRSHSPFFKLKTKISEDIQFLNVLNPFFISDFFISDEHNRNR